MAGLLTFALLTLDVSRQPHAQLTARALLAVIDLYRTAVSSHFEALGIRCRFEPTCSRYAAATIARDGALTGSLRSAWRIVRCGPWTERGTVDEP